LARNNEYLKSIDKHIGGKIQFLRLAKGFSREQLGNQIGVTHQQLQKYEKGINRISIGRMLLIAKALGKELPYFYEDLEIEAKQVVPTQHQRMCIEVSRNFMKIQNMEHQNAVNTLIKSLIKTQAA
jgi:transcriptional regulator with XRE-family HTH domain